MIKCYPGPEKSDYYCGFLSLRDIKAGEQLVWNYGEMCELNIRHQCPPNCASLPRPTMTDVPVGKASKNKRLICKLKLTLIMVNSMVNLNLIPNLTEVYSTFQLNCTVQLSQ